MDIVKVLKAAGYSAADRITGTQPIRNLPCPVVPHKNQTSNSGPAMCYPPGHGDENDLGAITCRNCDESWGAVALAEELAVTSEVMEGRERYIPPRVASRKRKERPPPEPIDINDVWIKAQATTPRARLAFEYFKRRWRDNKLADEALQFVGWTSGFKQDYWKRFKEHLLLVPLYDVHGSVVSAVRRFTGFGKSKIKSLRLANEAVGLPSGTHVWFGDPPPTVGHKCQSKVLYVAEGEIDTLLLLSMREMGLIEGAVLGSPGGAAGSPGWGDATAKLISEPPASVVLVMDADTAGDKYWQRSAQAFPNATRVILPDYSDLTDCVAKYGIPEAIALLNSAARSHQQFYQLDNGKFAYMSAGHWYEATGRPALIARLRNAGYDDEDAKGIAGSLPPAREVVFNPNSTQPVVIDKGNVWLNQFRGLHLKPEAGDYSKYIWLMHWLVGEDPDALEYVLDWLALPLQSLYKGTGAHRNKTALIFHGVQGSGKGFFWGTDGMMRAIYGNMMIEIMQSQMEDKFEPRTLASALMVVANEVACSGYRDAKTLNKLKAWITEPSIHVRRMQRAAEGLPIWFNMVLLSNDSMPIRLEPGDRRYSVFYQDAKLDPGVITTLVEERNAGWPGAKSFLKFLLDRKVDQDMATPYVNPARKELLDQSKPSEIQFAEVLQELGVSVVMKDWEAALGDKRQGPFTDASAGFMSSSHLYEVYKFWCQQHGISYPVRWPQLQNALLKTINGSRKHSSFSIGGTRRRGLVGLPIGGKKNLAMIHG